MRCINTKCEKQSVCVFKDRKVLNIDKNGDEVLGKPICLADSDYMSKCEFKGEMITEKINDNYFHRFDS